MENVKTSLTVVISRDGLAAFVRRTDPKDTEAISEEDLRQSLTDNGVVFGIKENLMALFEQQTVGGSVALAEGIKSIQGESGHIEYLYDTEGTVDKKQTANAENRVFKIMNAVKGMKLARIIPPGQGTPGKTVTDLEIPPYPGKPVYLRAAKNTMVSEEDPSIIVATGDGHIIRTSSAIEIETVLTIPGDIAFSTGDIDFVGSLIVRGDIKTGFNVKVKGNLEVQGNVEDAQLEVGGDVIIKKGFIGHSKGILNAKGDVTLGFVLNQTINTEKNVTIIQYCVNGTINAGDKINAAKASVVGGSLDALSEIHVKSLGSDQYSLTKVHIGRKGRILAKIAIVEKEIEQAKKALTDVKDALYKLARLKIDLSGKLPEDKNLIYNKLQAVQKALPDRLEQYEKEYIQLNEELKINYDAGLFVYDTLYENVLVDINGTKESMQATLKDVRMIEHEGALEKHSIESNRKETKNG